MSDPAQQIFDSAEAITEALHHLESCDRLMLEVLDTTLTHAPDKGGAVYALMEAARRFRGDVRAQAETLYRAAR